MKSSWPNHRGSIATTTNRPNGNAENLCQRVEKRRTEIELLQTRIQQICVSSLLPITDIKEINRKMSIGEAKARRAKKGNPCGNMS